MSSFTFNPDDMNKWMIQIDAKYCRFVIPGIVLEGTREWITNQMRTNPAYIEKIKLPHKCLECKFTLMPLYAATAYFKRLFEGEPEGDAV